MILLIVLCSDRCIIIAMCGSMTIKCGLLMAGGGGGGKFAKKRGGGENLGVLGGGGGAGRHIDHKEDEEANLWVMR